MITPAIFYSFSALITAIASAFQIFFTFFYAANRKTAKVFCFYLFTIAFWSFFVFVCTTVQNQKAAYFYSQICHVIGVFIPISFFHLVLELTHYPKKIYIRILSLGYVLVGAISLLIIAKPRIFIAAVVSKLSFPFFPDAGPLFIGWNIVFILFVLLGCLVLFNEYLRTKGMEKNRLLTFLLANLIGYSGGIGCFFPVYDLDFFPFPFGIFGVFFFNAITMYAIVRYNLMEIRIAAARTGIFVFVYCIVLGMPAVLVSQGRVVLEGYLGAHWWFLPAGLFAILSFSGPFFYLILQRKAEAVLLREQRAYQQTLLQASRGMTLVKDLNKLLKVIVHILTKTVKITHARIFLMDSGNSRFVCRAARGDYREGATEFIPVGSVLIERLYERMGPLMREEFYARQSEDDSVGREMESLNAAVVVPSFVQDRLLGFLVLGEKKSKRLYSESDLDILTTLANQGALAVENCIFLEEFEHQQAHFFQAAKMADLGTMASGIAHQVNNRFNVIKLGAESALMVDFPRIEKQMAANNLEGVRPLIGSLETVYRKIAKNADHGGEIVRRLLDFSRLSEGFGPVSVRDVAASCIRLWECKRPLYDIDFRMEIPDGLVKIHGNSSEVEEILFNLLDNAYDAIKMKEEAWACGKLEKPEHPVKGKITLSAREVFRRGRRCVEVMISDAGLGMTEEVRKQVFVPFFTTKATAIKGTGLGLYVIRKMVDAHQGEIELESVYGEGSSFRVFLPATGET